MLRRLIIIFILGIVFAGAIPAETDKEFIKIASWNIRIFSNSRTDSELRSICKVAQQFDFITIIELRDEAILKRMVSMLKNEFNKSYSYEMSMEVGATSKERYAFLYDNTIIKCVKSGEIFADTTFLRSPYYATFKAGNFDFTTICIHVIWGNTVGERRKEINRLAYVFNTLQDRDLLENDIMLMGDFNRGPDDDLAWAPMKSISSMTHLFDLPEKSMIWDTELYDNIWFQSLYVKEFTLDKGIYNFDEIDFGNDDTAASLAVSDHRPIWGLFRITNQDDD